MHVAMIALGGNLGDVRATFDSACKILTDSCHILARSRLYMTPAIGPLYQGKPQPDYLNAVIQVSTTKSAHRLLQILHEIEVIHGRERLQHWGARTLDLDLLCYDHLICEDDRLTLPHPLLHTRQFVLQPMADIQPNWLHPRLGLDVESMLQSLNDNQTCLSEGEIWTNNS